jgi:hypothetical protein
MMPRTATKRTLSKGFWQGLREIDMYFQGRDPVHQTMRRLVRRLAKASIPHAVAGGMAVFAHKYRRTTDDVDVLLTRQGLERFRELFVPKKYEPWPRRSRRFTDRISKVSVDFLVTGLFPGSGEPGPVVYPDPESVRTVIEKTQVVNLPTLVELKLAARRHQDFADVVNLIRFNNLDESFANQLNPSVQRDYIECLEEKRREDEYEERKG